MKYKIITKDDIDIKPDNKTIYYEEKFDSFEDAFNNAKDFINKNLEGILLNNGKIKLQKKPKISAIIPCYNCGDYVLRAIRSIQNQNFSNFEIIIVNDFSSDNTSLFLNEIQKQDPRLRVLNNKKNMGTFFSRANGILFAKGKYIFPIDSDDMFLDEKVFSEISSIADKGNFDIVVFNSISINLHHKKNVNSVKINHLIFEGHKPNLVLVQPELGYYPIKPGKKIDYVKYREVHIFSRCIKTKIFVKALNNLGQERLSRYIIWDDDLISNYINFNTAEIAKFVPKYGYLYIEVNKSWRDFNKIKVKLFMMKVYVMDAVIEFSKDFRKNKMVLVNFIIFFLKHDYLKEALNADENNKKVFISCLDRILKCKLISEENKNLIRKKVKVLDFINYNN